MINPLDLFRATRALTSLTAGNGGDDADFVAVF
jgi:hypothetical protein